MKAHGLHYVQDWLAGEVAYTQAKFGVELDDEHTREFADRAKQFENTYWQNQLNNYLFRAHVLSLDIPSGRQALAKFVATAEGFLMSAVRLYGPLPLSGVPSGENLDDLMELY